MGEKASQVLKYLSFYVYRMCCKWIAYILNILCIVTIFDFIKKIKILRKTGLKNGVNKFF